MPMTDSWSAFLAMVPPTVTHNDLVPYRRRDGSMGIRKSEALHAAEDALDARIRAAGPPPEPLGSRGEALAVTVRVCYPCAGGHAQGAPHTARPDLDNLLKTLGDRLQAMGVVADDSRVCQWDASKAWCDPAGVYVSVAVVPAGGAL